MLLNQFKSLGNHKWFRESESEPESETEADQSRVTSQDSKESATETVQIRIQDFLVETGRRSENETDEALNFRMTCHVEKGIQVCTDEVLPRLASVSSGSLEASTDDNQDKKDLDQTENYNIRDNHDVNHEPSNSSQHKVSDTNENPKDSAKGFIEDANISVEETIILKEASDRQEDKKLKHPDLSKDVFPQIVLVVKRNLQVTTRNSGDGRIVHTRNITETTFGYLVKKSTKVEDLPTIKVTRKLCEAKLGIDSKPHESRVSRFGTFEFYPSGKGDIDTSVGPKRVDAPKKRDFSDNFASHDEEESISEDPTKPENTTEHLNWLVHEGRSSFHEESVTIEMNESILATKDTNQLHKSDGEASLIAKHPSNSKVHYPVVQAPLNKESETIKTEMSNNSDEEARSTTKHPSNSKVHEPDVQLQFAKESVTIEINESILAMKDTNHQHNSDGEASLIVKQQSNRKVHEPDVQTPLNKESETINTEMSNNSDDEAASTLNYPSSSQVHEPDVQSPLTKESEIINTEMNNNSDDEAASTQNYPSSSKVHESDVQSLYTKESETIKTEMSNNSDDEAVSTLNYPSSSQVHEPDVQSPLAKESEIVKTEMSNNSDDEAASTQNYPSSSKVHEPDVQSLLTKESETIKTEMSNNSDDEATSALNYPSSSKVHEPDVQAPLNKESVTIEINESILAMKDTNHQHNSDGEASLVVKQYPK